MQAYEAIPQAIRTAIESLSAGLLNRSGGVFYTGPNAFTKPSTLYVLGLNPGGAPSSDVDATVAAYLRRFKSQVGSWSEYQDAGWEGAEPGSWGLQPRVLHMFAKLRLDPQRVPSSNVVFVNSRTESDLAHEKSALLTECWPVHRAVIESLGVRTILCFGTTAGLWVRTELGAAELVDSFVETNKRGWTSRVHRNSDGIEVVTATHPSRADWRNPSADPTPLVAASITRGQQA